MLYVYVFLSLHTYLILPQFQHHQLAEGNQSITNINQPLFLTESPISASKSPVKSPILYTIYLKSLKNLSQNLKS